MANLLTVNYSNTAIYSTSTTGGVRLNTDGKKIEENIEVEVEFEPAPTPFAQINVTFPIGSDCSATNGTITLTADNRSGGYTFNIPEPNSLPITWTLTISDGNQTASKNITITEWHQNINKNIAYISNVLNDNDWNTISEIAQAGEGDTYWDIGDCKEVILNGAIGAGLTLTNFTTYVFILDFNHVDNGVNDNNIIFGGFKTALSNGKDICLCDSNYNNDSTSGKYFNLNHVGKSSSPYNTNYGGWKGCDFRYDILGATQTAPSPYNTNKTTSTTGTDATTSAITSPISNTLMAALPSNFRNVLRLRTHYVDNKGNSSNVDANVTAVADAIALLAEFEIFGARTHANQYEQNHQSQMAYYSNSNSKIKYKHNATNTAAIWWNCSPYYNSPTNFGLINDQGIINRIASRTSCGLAPIFKI